jgi:prophage regulatory protein
MSRILGKRQMREKVPYGDRHLRNLEAKGEFPKRFPITPNGRVVGWLESEIDDWIAERAAARDPEQEAA